MLESLKDKYLSILPIEKSFFYYVLIDEKKKFEQDILYLNFAHISPYKDFEILPYHEDKRLLLWFYPKQIRPNNILIPQAYLLYLYAKTQDNNAVFIIENTIDTLLVVKDGLLEASYSGYGLKDQQEALLDEYGLENLYTLTSLKTRKIEKEQLQNYPIWQYYHWYQSEHSLKENALGYLEKAVIPLAIIIGVFIASEYAKDRYINNYYEDLQEEYKAVKKQNDPYRKELKAIKRDITFTHEFYYNILRYPNSIDVMENLFNIVAKDGNNTIKNFKLSGDKVTLNIETHDAITILNKSLKSGYFEEFKVGSSRKLRKNDKDAVSYQGVLKGLKESNGE